MKTLLTILIAATIMTSCGQTSNNVNSNKNIMTVSKIDTTSEQLIYKGRFVEVYVEKAIYHSTTNSNFLMKVSIKNTSNKTIGVDLTNYWKVIYLNHCEFSEIPRRYFYNEVRMIPDTVINTTVVVNRFKNNSLTLIKPNETLEYYGEWEPSENFKKLESEYKGCYLIIGVDGQLLFTNGEEFEHITFNKADESNRVFLLSCPINHKTIPEKAVIIKRE